MPCQVLFITCFGSTESAVASSELAIDEAVLAGTFAMLPGSMSFSARQQHCLLAMGLVPWVLKNAPMAQTRPLPAWTHATVPPDLQILAQWLPEQFLAPFHWRGNSHTLLGLENASILVVVETVKEQQGQLPLDGDALQLFELMLRSINLTRQQIRLCTMDMEPEGRTSSVENVPTVSSACTAQTRALLLLQQDWSAFKGLPLATDHVVRMQHPPVSVWRMPHPDIVLRHNALKRQTWEVLKAVQSVL